MSEPIGDEPGNVAEYFVARNPGLGEVLKRLSQAPRESFHETPLFAANDTHETYEDIYHSCVPSIADANAEFLE